MLYPIVMDYSKSLIEMIGAGNYDWVNAQITDKHFPIERRRKFVGVELVNYNTRLHSHEVMERLRKSDLRPVTLPEVLAFGAASLNERLDFTIVALGSVWQQGRDCWRWVTAIGHDDRGRVLDLASWNARWGQNVRFAAVYHK